MSSQAHLSRFPLLALWTVHQARLWLWLAGQSCLTQGCCQATDCPVQAGTIIYSKEVLDRVHAWHQATQLLWVSSRQAQYHHFEPSCLGLTDRAEEVTSQGLIHKQNHHPRHLPAASRSIQCQEVSVSCNHCYTQVVPTRVHVGDVVDILQDDARIIGAVQRQQWGGPVTVGQEANLDSLWPKRPN